MNINPNVEASINKFIETRFANVVYDTIDLPCIRIYHFNDWNLKRKGWRGNKFQIDVFEINSNRKLAKKKMQDILTAFGFAGTSLITTIPLLDADKSYAVIPNEKIIIRQIPPGIRYIPDKNTEVRHYTLTLDAEYKAC